MSLESRIMNLPTPELGHTNDRERIAVNFGAKGIRHAAAEIASEGDALIAEMLEVLEAVVISLRMGAPAGAILAEDSPIRQGMIAIIAKAKP